MDFKVQKGSSLPFGVKLFPNGINFSVFANKVEGVTLELFDYESGSQLGAFEMSKSMGVWHIFIEGVPIPCCYGYKVRGSNDLLLDPYAKVVNTSNKWGQGVPFKANEKNTTYHPKGVILPDSSFDWQGVESPSLEAKDLIIYEMHVRGFTQHSSSQSSHPGTFLGIIDKIPYLKELGVNAIELLPVQEFNELEYPRLNPVTKQPLYNYWGYSTVNFFALMNRYAAGEKPGDVINEFKTMVRELHRNGIEVILDLVFNHTAESLGYKQSFSGLANSIYYMLDAEGKNLDFTGCGNTVNANHTVVRDLIRSVLRYLVTELKIDGFRFDLASALTRGEQGKPLSNPPLIEAMTEDPVLSNTKLIAEPWDVGGLYQVGGFYTRSKRWKEWNGKYRDTARRYIKGGEHEKEYFATRLCGSQDLYGAGRSPLNSVNFITCHDGFTLADLVSYNQKHNEENGEDNRDGLNENDSWNCGAEGATQDKKILSLRQRQMRNLHMALMVSQGIPMIHMGDEYQHTRKGNNNGWAQDNELNWFLWDKIKQHEGFYRFYTKLIQFRKTHEVFRQGIFLTPENIVWHGLEPGKPNWSADDRFIAFTLMDKKEGHDLYIAFNISNHPLTLNLPPLSDGKVWKAIVDTFSASPKDFCEEKDAPVVKNGRYRISSYSSIILKAI